MYVTIAWLQQNIPNAPSYSTLSRMARGWESRLCRGKGGGMEYLVASLPVEWQQIISCPTPNAPQTRDVPIKLTICRVYRQWCIDNQQVYGGFKSLIEFARLWSKGSIVHPAWVSFSRFSYRSLLRWLKKDEDEFNTKRKGKVSIFNKFPELKSFIEGIIHHRPSLILKEIRAHFPQINISRATLYRYIRKWIEENPIGASIRYKGTDKTRSKHLPAFGNMSEGVDHFGQLIEIDCTKFELLLKGEDGKLIRYAVLGAIDVYSRRKIFKAVPVADRYAVTRGLIRAIYTDWGYVGVIKTDNGTEFKNNYLQSVLQDIGTELRFCNPGCPQEKPHIERAFGSLKTMLAQSLPGYVGSNPVERKQLDERIQHQTKLDILLSPQELQELLDAYVASEDERARDGFTPYSRYQERKSIKQIPPAILDRLLYEPLGERTVGKEGIRVNSTYYIAAELGEWVGSKVNIKAPDDAGVIDVYHLDGRFICRAEAPELTGKSRQQIAAMARQVYNSRVKAEKAKHKAALAEERLTTYRESEEVSVESIPTKLVAVDEMYINPAVMEVSNALELERQKELNNQPADATPKERERFLSVLKKQPSKYKETPKERFDRLCQILMRGKYIHPEDAQWMAEQTEVKKNPTFTNAKRIYFGNDYPKAFYESLNSALVN